ncbi:MAG: hypothetical protein ACI7YS_17580 [Flavobacterium sp.]
MFQLFKKREFGDYISDTFQFFKETGKHYLKNYFTISGVMLLLLVAITYIISQFYFDFIFRIDRTANNPDMLMAYFTDNFNTILGIGGAAFMVMIFLHMLNFSIPVIYLNLYDKNNGGHFGFQDILREFKSNFGKVFTFFLATFFLIMPLIFFAFVIFLLLSFVIIGLPLLFFGIPAAYCWITLSFYEYINTGAGYFKALGAGWNTLRSQFFPIVGSVMVLFLIIQISITVLTLIPSIFGVASVFTSLENPGQTEDAFSGMRVVLTVVMVLSSLISFILNNLLLINQGLVYYSRKEADENKISNESIDWIGRE